MKETENYTLPEVRTPLPGPRSKLLVDRYSRCFGNLKPPQMAIERAYDCMYEDMDGNRYLVLAQSTCVAGFSNPEIVNACIEQIKKIAPRATASPPLIEFTEKLMEKLPGELKQGRVNHAASGTETVEMAVMIARMYTGRPIVLSYHDSHHGYMGTPSQLSGDPSIKRRSPAKISDIIQVPYPKCYRCQFGQSYPDCDILCLAYLENILETAVFPDQVAGLLIEPILVNGGMYVPPDEYVKGVVDICVENDIQLIDDEVYTGVAKSGKFLMVDHWNITPDILCLGKAIGGGFPLAAVVTKRRITDETYGGVRFTGTFAGNLVACSAGIATLDYVDKHDLAEKAEKVGNHLSNSLRDLSERKRSIGDVRGRGLLIGVDLVKDKETREPATKYASEMVWRALEKGLIIRAVGRYKNILALTPSLTLSSEQVEKTVHILDELTD